MKIDDRETKILKYFLHAEVEHLEIGDIICDNICIERKTAEDFLASIKDHRVFNQAINMHQNYEHAIIIVESDLSKLADLIHFGQYKMSMEQVRGAVSSLYVKYKVPVLLASTRKNFIELVNLLVTKSQEDCNPIVFNPAFKKINANPKLQVLLQIPGIGETKAKKILDHYSLFSNIDFMERPKGISEKDIENIKEVLK